MQRKIRLVIMFVILITLTLSNIAYAQPTTRQNAPYGPKVEELKGKEDIIRNLEQMKKIRSNLTIIDIFFSEQISFVADSYIISLRLQQNLIRALESNNAEAKKLFSSNYLIPVYYYLTLGDQMIAYIDTYFVLS